MEQQAERLLVDGKLLDLSRPGRSLLPASEQNESAERTGEQLPLPVAVPDAARQLDGAIAELEGLRVAITRLEDHGEVVVGSQGSSGQVVCECVSKRPLEHDPTL